VQVFAGRCERTAGLDVFVVQLEVWTLFDLSRRSQFGLRREKIVRRVQQAGPGMRLVFMSVLFGGLLLFFDMK
jgi:hypothetical protein